MRELQRSGSSTRPQVLRSTRSFSVSSGCFASGHAPVHSVRSWIPGETRLPAGPPRRLTWSDPRRRFQNPPARHAGWSHYWQPGGPITGLWRTFRESARGHVVLTARSALAGSILAAVRSRWGSVFTQSAPEPIAVADDRMLDAACAPLCRWTGQVGAAATRERQASWPCNAAGPATVTPNDRKRTYSHRQLGKIPHRICIFNFPGPGRGVTSQRCGSRAVGFPC